MKNCSMIRVDPIDEKMKNKNEVWGIDALD